MEKVVLYVGLTDEENKALNSEEIESTLAKRNSTNGLCRNIKL